MVQSYQTCSDGIQIMLVCKNKKTKIAVGHRA
jgi:hypothetical protein